MGSVRAVRPRGLVLAVWVVLCVFALVRMVVAVYDMRALDLEVYRRAGMDLLAGVSPYVTRDSLPFTYPPFAAIVAIPLGWVSGGAAWAAVTAGNVASVVICTWVLMRQVRPQVSLWWFLPCVAALSPVWRTFELGQVNLVLMTLVLLDVFVVPARHRGWLVGLATGIKLVPGIFVLYYLARREYRAAAQALTGAALTVLAAATVLPRDSVVYWFDLIRDPSRIGHLEYVDNVSATGALARMPLEIPQQWSLALGLIVVSLGAALARRLSDRGDQLGAVVAVALAGLCASPVTWSHHWVWGAPLLAWALHRGDVVLAAATGIVMVATPLEWASIVPDPTWQAVTGLAFVALAVSFAYRSTHGFAVRHASQASGDSNVDEAASASR